MSARSKIQKKKLESKIARVPSNFFKALDQTQIRLFKEAFNIIDQDRNGMITIDDLKGILTSLGQHPTARDITEMLGGRDSINFTTFLSMFGSRMASTDPDDVIINAFSCLGDGDGKVSAKYLKELLTTMGERMDYQQVSLLYQDVDVDNEGNIDYVKCVRLLKNGIDDSSVKHLAGSCLALVDTGSAPITISKAYD